MTVFFWIDRWFKEPPCDHMACVAHRKNDHVRFRYLKSAEHLKGKMVVWLFLLWTRATLCMVFLDIFCITLNIQVCECVCFHVCGDMCIWHMFQLSLHHMRELVIDNCDWNETWDLHSPIKNNYEPQGGTDCYCISSLTSNLKPDNK